MINLDPVTLPECLDYWIWWRFVASHKFCRDCMRLNSNTRAGNQNINKAPVIWYISRFIAAWKLGKPYIIRARREMRRKSKV